MSPADPATYCPVCGLEWQVRGCTPEKCKAPAETKPATDATRIAALVTDLRRQGWTLVRSTDRAPKP